MRRKKQIPEQKVRQVRPQQSANVFSYYANRSTGENVRTRRGMHQAAAPTDRKKPKLRPDRAWLPLVPSFIAGAVLAGCLLYISSLSSDPKLQIAGNTKLGITHDVTEYEAGIRKILDSSITNKSKLLINSNEIAGRIADEYPELGDVSVVLPLIGRRPVVQAEPAAPKLVLTTVDGGFVLDENGRIMAEAADIESSVRDALPVLRDESGLSLELGRYALSKESVNFVAAVAAQLQRKDMTIQSMILPTVPNEMHVRMAGKPYYVKFNLRDESRVQAGTYLATHKKLSQDNVEPREYIDVRVPGKVYYK